MPVGSDQWRAEIACTNVVNVDIFRNDHPCNNKIGGACLCYREGLPIKGKKDLDCLQEMVVAEVIIERKKIMLATMYRSPARTIDQFEEFINGPEAFVSRIQAERPYMIITGDFNCGLALWWPQDTEHHEGGVLDELI